MNESPIRQPTYVRNVVFDSGYVGRQRPVLLNYIAASAGYVPPNPASGYTYLELGCSVGATLNGLAASNPQARFVGIDFNEEHIALAIESAKSVGLSNVEYHEAAFTDFQQFDLPQFDYIAIHGTYSWLGPDAEAAVHAILDRHLKQGGIFYVDYMSMPGKASVAPIWYLMRELTADFVGDSAERARVGFEMLRSLDRASAHYFKENPQSKRAFRRWDQEIQADPERIRHLAHNALAEHWSPKFFTEIVQSLAAVGLQFAGNTRLDLNDLELALPSALRDGGGPMADRTHTELIKDYFHNMQTRQDVFVRASSSTPEAAESYFDSAVHFMCLSPPDFRSWEFRDPDDNLLELDEDLFEEIVSAMAEGATCIDQIAEGKAVDRRVRDDIAGALGRMILRPDLEILAAPPSELRTIAYRKVFPANRYNEMAIEEVIEKGGVLRLASSTFGGCIVFPKLMSAVMAVCLGQQQVSMDLGRVVELLRAVPGTFNIQGRSEKFSNVDHQMIAPLWRKVQLQTLPNLIRLEAVNVE